MPEEFSLISGQTRTRCLRVLKEINTSIHVTVRFCFYINRQFIISRTSLAFEDTSTPFGSSPISPRTVGHDWF